ncbi:uncharacterized protein LOC125498808 [Beta vulgaris subsp. vulgaris]|uniref:uncharacterized protein LOC125498808 n=1 Tax=Beta vulgaris subsp. vulgaris TaxID=3555 RepID=UPI002036DE7D|nr:uncharacterized protein LOC125498808 [Beta vulgaris subsp. vulgaris]
MGEIVLPVASSGIASLFLPKGRTAHSRFGLPLNVCENSTCVGIRPSSDLVALLMRTKLIIWDEAPMMHKYCFETLDRSLKDIMQAVIELICIDHLEVLKLTRNMILQSCSSSSTASEIRDFSEWILSVGDGRAGGPNDGEVDIEITEDILIDGGDDPISSIVDNTYPSLTDHLWEAKYFQERAILAPTNEIVEKVNDHVLSTIPGDEKIYLSCDAVSKDEGNLGAHDIYSTEFLNTIKCSGLPNHSSKLKVGAPIMLLPRKSNSGLCNGTRVVVKHLGNRVIEATAISGSNVGDN